MDVQETARCGLATGKDRARILLVDDHDLTRAGLRMVVGRDPGLEVIGEARDGLEAIEMAQTLQPDLVLMDLSMPRMDGLEAMRAIKRTSPTISVLILSMYEDTDVLLEAIKAGAAGYLLKTADERRLRTAIHEALDGDLPVDPRMTRVVFRRLSESAQPAASAPADLLTARERDVLVLLARGKTNPEIARELFITQHTVKVHVQHILSKLEVSDRTQAAVRAIELGYLPQPGRAEL